MMKGKHVVSQWADSDLWSSVTLASSSRVPSSSGQAGLGEGRVCGRERRAAGWALLFTRQDFSPVPVVWKHLPQV